MTLASASCNHMPIGFGLSLSAENWLFLKAGKKAGNERGRSSRNPGVGTDREFCANVRTSGERHQQRLLPWSLPTKGVQNRLLLCFVPPRSDAVRNLVPRFDRARNLTPGLPPSSLAV